MTRHITALTVISDFLHPMEGKHILDIGCGRGDLSTPLRVAGAKWIGVDPHADKNGDGAITKASAEALPFPDSSFEAVIYLNALHHVAVPEMAQAMLETARVLAPTGRLVIIEPLATGALSTVLAVVDDETEIRAAALTALRRATDHGLFRLITTQTYLRRETFTHFENFATRMIAVDQNRAAAIRDQSDALEEQFQSHALSETRGFVLEQPMRADVLEKA